MDLILFPEDLNSAEQNSLTSYIQNGCPGLSKIDDVKVFRWFELYMSGKSYHEISVLTKDKKDLIVYIAYKAKWHEKRMEYYKDLTTNYTAKLKHVKLDSANTVINAITALGKYYNDQFNKFLISDDKNIINNLDTKMLGQYYKSLEVLEKIINPNGRADDDHGDNSGKKPVVNINVNNAQISQDGDTIDIQADTQSNTDAQKAASNLLKAMSEFQRSKDKN